MGTVVLLPLVALGLYAGISYSEAEVTADKESHPDRFGSEPYSRDHPGQPVASVGSLVDGLRNRLQQDPDDAAGWLLLARSYEHLGRHPEAMLAYQRARSLGKTDLKLEDSPPGMIVAVQDPLANSKPVLRGRVALSPEAASRVNPDDTIFIFAKESSDHRMPVVVLRKPAAELPIDFVLTDEHAMVPGTHLADFETVVVSARVSRSGLATDILEGLDVASEPVSPTDGGKIELLISTRLPIEDRRDE